MSKTSDNDEDEDFEQLQYKVILLGDGAVGKTSIAARFADDNFSQIYKQTIGVDFFIRRLILPPSKHIALQIWDIGGQSIGSKMITNYISGANAVLLCYDITNYESFANLEDCRFATENEMHAFLMSAKSGDQVRQAFTKIAASLSGVYVSKADMDMGATVIPAQIVNH
eukprot:gene8219-16896_t